MKIELRQESQHRLCRSRQFTRTNVGQRLFRPGALTTAPAFAIKGGSVDRTIQTDVYSLPTKVAHFDAVQSVAQMDYQMTNVFTKQGKADSPTPTYPGCSHGVVREKDITETSRVETSGLRTVNHFWGCSERPRPPRCQHKCLVSLLVATNARYP